MRRFDAGATIAGMSPTSLLRFIALAALAVVGGLAALASPASATPRTTEYKLPEFSVPNGITTGPDGAVWVTDSSLGQIYRISVKGRIRTYELGEMPTGITTAYGSMWVADDGGDALHRVETDGSSTRIPLRDGSFPTAIVKGADGAMWFLETRGDAIGRLALDGTITEYPIPTPGTYPAELVLGSDGALYFGEALAGKVGRVTTDGTITEYTMPGDQAMPGAIVSAPDGSLYVSDRNNNTIDRMTTAGEFTDSFELPRENADPGFMIAGPDGSLYISEHMTGVISKMSYDGTFTKKYRIPGGYPDALTAGPDGALWVNRGSDQAVVRLDIGFDPPVTAHGTTITARVGREAKHTVATFTDADPNARARDYDVTISWGDGSKSDGWVRRAGDDSFVVRGRHTYARPGTRRVVVRITDGVGKGIDAKVESTAVVTR
jgi:virginiamycin B lyase